MMDKFGQPVISKEKARKIVYFIAAYYAAVVLVRLFEQPDLNQVDVMLLGAIVGMSAVCTYIYYQFLTGGEIVIFHYIAEFKDRPLDKFMRWFSIVFASLWHALIYFLLPAAWVPQ